MSPLRLLLLTLATPVLADPPTRSDPPALDVPPIHDEAPAPRARLWALWENDSVYTSFFDSSDRYDTNAVRLALALDTRLARDLAVDLPSLDAIEPTRSTLGLLLGHNIYTPADLTQTALIPDDRPYAGWLFLAPFLQRRDDHTLDHLQLDLGIVGDHAYAEDLQKWVHSNFSGVPPEGWDNQLGGEFGVNLHLAKAWRFDLGQPIPGLDTQLLPDAALTLGTIFRHAQAGATLRAGWNLPDDFGPGRADQVPDLTPDPAISPWSAYAFVHVQARAVQHNTFVNGSDFRDGHGVDHEPLVARADFGLAFRLWGCLDLSYNQSFTTDEFELQAGGRHRGVYTLTLFLPCP